MSSTPERRIVVEVVSHSDVQRLDERIDKLQLRIDVLSARVEAVNKQFYDLLERLGRRSRP